MTAATIPSTSLREWYPLESSPEVFTSMGKSWGLPSQYSFIDIPSLEPVFLGEVAGPVHAIIFLFPDTPSIVTQRGKEGPCLPSGVGCQPLWIPQVDVGHSCGTFALVHALAQTHLAPALEPFFQACLRTNPEERTKLFASSKPIYSAHHANITSGQTRIRESDWEDCDHFLSFVQAEVEGKTRLVEMDGNPPRTGPLDRGESKDLLEDVARVIKEVYMSRAEGNEHFSMIALVG